MILSVALVFSVLTPGVFAADDTINTSEKRWISSKYEEVLNGDGWEKKINLKIFDNSTGAEIQLHIPAINSSDVNEELFRTNLPGNLEILDFDVEINPNYVKVESDYSIFAVDTLFDIGAFTISINEYISNPSFWSGVSVVLDGLALALPFVPAVGNLTVSAIKSSARMTTAVEKGIKPYNTLSRELSGSGLHAHHIMPQKFANNFNVNPSEMFSIAVDPTTHTAITARFNSFFPGPASSYTSTYVKNNTKYLYQQMYLETNDYFFKFMADFIEVGQFAPRK
ncbi:hypothetical protein JJQ72_02350 [Paenibacillus sp. F411]|uniref:hypothetical protein n=1 Tax=Paenibacillus sp. F411 TaxID=2820239 RepID=UPI001AAF9F11|nr:hypothetical protein [Paenibacillus sp. F411]MBO2942826.1 hypothetical protein [Paenibacillus sp. F411]